MSFKGKFEAITEATLGRFQQGGIMVGDIVKIKANALNHPKVKEMADNMKGNIEMLMNTDLHLSVSAVKSIRGSQGDMSDGLGLGSTTAPTDFWVDICVLHSPGQKGNPVTLPIEVLERQDFGANLPPIPDSQKRIGNVNIKPVDASKYVIRMGESLEGAYEQVGGEKEQVTVRVPIEDCDETKDILDEAGVTYSVIGTNRYELHGEMDVIQAALNSISSAFGCECDGEVDVEFVGGDDKSFDMSTQQIPTDTGMPEIDMPPEPKGLGQHNGHGNSLEEAYNGIMTGEVRAKQYIIEVPNAFADNIRTYLASEGVSNSTTVDGNKSFISISSLSDRDQIGVALKDNVMGDLTYMKVHKSDQQLSES